MAWRGRNATNLGAFLFQDDRDDDCCKVYMGTGRRDGGCRTSSLSIPEVRSYFAFHIACEAWLIMVASELPWLRATADVAMMRGVQISPHNNASCPQLKQGSLESLAFERAVLRWFRRWSRNPRVIAHIPRVMHRSPRRPRSAYIVSSQFSTYGYRWTSEFIQDEVLMVTRSTNLS